MQHQVVTLSVVSLELARESIPDTWKENWWVDRYAWLWWVPITLFEMHFHGCHYSVCLLSVPGEQSNFKYQWIAIWNIYKKDCVWRSIATNFECFSFSCVQSELSTIYLVISMCASIEPTATNWKWIAKGRFEVLWRVHIKGALSSLIQFLASESPLKKMKNVFHFTLKALFVLKIFKFLSCLFGHVGKRLD